MTGIDPRWSAMGCRHRHAHLPVIYGAPDFTPRRGENPGKRDCRQKRPNGFPEFRELSLLRRQGPQRREKDRGFRRGARRDRNPEEQLSHQWRHRGVKLLARAGPLHYRIEMSAAERPSTSNLPRRRGLWSAGAVLVGSTIGSGIFRSPAGIADKLP